MAGRPCGTLAYQPPYPVRLRCVRERRGDGWRLSGMGGRRVCAGIPVPCDPPSCVQGRVWRGHCPESVTFLWSLTLCWPGSAWGV